MVVLFVQVVHLFVLFVLIVCVVHFGVFSVCSVHSGVRVHTNFFSPFLSVCLLHLLFCSLGVRVVRVTTCCPCLH